MSNAIATINAALESDGFKAAYDAIEQRGGLYRAAAYAAMAYEMAELHEECPVSSARTEYPATVRPGKR